MSHYSVCKTQLKDNKAILDALERMGFKRADIDVSDTPMVMKMYNGPDAVDPTTKQKRTANIRIKGHGWGKENKLDGLCNDMGFTRQKDGTYELHIDNYTSGRYKNFQDKITNYYAAELTKNKAKGMGFFLQEETETEDEIVLKLTTPY